MKRIFSYFIAAFFAMAMMAGGAMAGTIEVTNGWTLAQEMLGDTLDRDLEGVSGKTTDLEYVPGFDLVSDTEITFHLANAAWDDAAYHLRGVPDPDSTTGTIDCGSAISVGTNDIVIFLTEKLVSANTYALTATAGIEDRASITIDAGLADAAAVQLSVTGVIKGSTSFNVALADATAVVTIADQFEMTCDGTTSTIDVGADPPRTLFDTGGVTSESPVDFTDNVAAIDDDIVLAVADELTLTLTPSTDMGGVESVALLGLTDTTFTDDQAVLVIDGVTLADGTLIITIDGSTVLETRSFTGSASLNFDGADEIDETYNLGTTHTWDINGWQGMVNYMNADPNYVTFIKISNSSTTQTSEVFVDVFDDDGNVYNTLTLTSIGPKSTQIYKAADIQESLSIPGNAFSALFTTTVSPAQITATAVQKALVDGGQRVLPVYSGSAGALSY